MGVNLLDCHSFPSLFIFHPKCVRPEPQGLEVYELGEIFWAGYLTAPTVLGCPWRRKVEFS